MDYNQFKILASPYINVSHETFMRLEAYVELLKLWQPHINLVSAKTIDTIWERHILDSLQVAPLLPTVGQTVDLGSGGGFPAAILAIVTGKPFALIESDQRKSAFLQEVSRVTQSSFTVLTDRVERLDGKLAATAVTARAFAPLPKLLSLSAQWLEKGAIGVFLKGKGIDDEIATAQTDWVFEAVRCQSVSDLESAILVVSNLAPR